MFLLPDTPLFVSITMARLLFPIETLREINQRMIDGVPAPRPASDEIRNLTRNLWFTSAEINAAYAAARKQIESWSK